MWTDLLEAALTLVIAFLLRLLLQAIGVEIDEKLFATIVAAMVVWILRLLGVELTVRAFLGTRKLLFGK